MATIIDSYSESNQDSTLGGVGYTKSRVGQSFIGDGTILNSVKFYLKKNSGSPTGNATAKLYAHSGTYGTSSAPTGSALDTSTTFDVSTLSTSYALITFTFSGGYTLTNSTKYFIEFDYSSGGPTNNVGAGYDSSSPSHGGNMWDDNSGSNSGTDLIFYVYGVSPFNPAFARRRILI